MQNASQGLKTHQFFSSLSVVSTIVSNLFKYTITKSFSVFHVDGNGSRYLSSLVCGKVGGPGDLVNKTGLSLLIEPSIIFRYTD